MIGALLLAACAGYDGRGLRPGVASEADVVALMGEPAMRWTDADGRQQLAYPRGPAGVHTYMVWLGPDGRLERIENVLEERGFARLRPGQSDQAEVLRLLGPPQPQWTQYFKARDELVWEWRYCAGPGFLARFDVLFDGTTGIMRTAFTREDLIGPEGTAPMCGR